MSLKQTRRLVRDFLSVPAGGVRLQAVVAAMFRNIGKRFRLFNEVRCGAANVADARSGVAADLECMAENNKVVLAVEVKDGKLRLRHVQDKLPAARGKEISELLFLVHGGTEPEENGDIDSLIEREFITGQNIYVCEFETFLDACLVLFGEEGRGEFLREIGMELNNQRADIVHRRGWSDALLSL
ncbi:MAG: hypothetical protein N3A38_02840 [Planctomycetota bacterium]|nr:hypothetical protein [Planctomycetota bacterium]